MIKFEFNGKPFDPRTFEETIMKQAMEAAAEHLRERIGTIRHPETGEFPTIVVSGTSFDDLMLRVEGSPELLALVNERMELTGDEPSEAMIEVSNESPPKVFLSYAWEDRDLASNIAEQLQANGIDTWWAEWCLSAGDSLRQKIDEGLGDCSHFLVLLTPTSLSKPWVNQEMDAGLVLKLQSKVKFIPLRHRLSVNQLPLLLRGMLSPEVDEGELGIAQLINDIHGVTKKPPLGKAPAAVSESRQQKTGYSAAANAVAKAFVELTQHARKFDPQFPKEKLMEETGLPEDDLVDALHELSGMVIARHDVVWPEDELFAKFDQFWKPWNPSQDALMLATDMLNYDSFPTSPAEIGQKYGWEPRRLNPAMAYLINRKVVRELKAMDGSNWLVVHIQKTDQTRRFVKSRT